MVASQSQTSLGDFQLPTAQQNQAQQTVVVENRMAALTPMVPASKPIPRSLVLLRRTEPVERPPSPEELEAKIQRMAGALVAEREQAILEAAAAASAQQAGLIAAQTGQQLAASEQRLKQYSDALTQQVATETKTYAAQNTQATADQLKTFAEEAAARAAMAAQQAATATSEQQAKQAEARSKAFVVGELATRESITAAKLGELSAQASASEARTKALLETSSAQLAALTQTTSAQLSAQQQVLAAQLSAQQQTASATSSAKLEALAASNNAYWQSTQSQLVGLDNQTTKALADVRMQLAAASQQGKEYARLQALEAQLKAQQNAIATAQTEAQQAESRAKTFTAEQMAARNEVIGSQIAALKETTGIRFDTNQKLTEAKLENVATRLNAADAQTRTELAANQKVNEARFSNVVSKLEQGQQLTKAELTQLQQATASQLGALDKSTADRIQNLADNTRTGIQWQQDMTAAQLAALDDKTQSNLQAIQHTTGSQFEAMNAIQAARHQATVQQLAGVQEATNAKLDAAEMASSLRNAQTVQRLEDLEQLTASNQRLMQAESRRMASVLSQYTDTQFAALSQQTDATIAHVASVGKMDVEDLRHDTANQLKTYYQAAKLKSEQLTKATETKLANRIAQAQTESETKRLKPEQVKAMAKETFAESAPEVRAVTLQTLADAQDYIRTVASNAVKDGDPEMGKALQKAARDVIVKDKDIVFAMRKVADKQLEKRLVELNQPTGPVKDAQGRTTVYSAGDDVSINSKGLGVAPIGGDAAIEPAAGDVKLAGLAKPSMMKARQRQDWIDLRKYRVIVHEDGKTLPQLLGDVMGKAETYTGPWEVKWKIDPKNNDVLNEKFSLDAETTFEEFVNYLANYMVNARGVKLSFSLFDSERVLVISD
ncbi:MAG: hypothetical protein WAZ18_00290 [Alphaproteobacteria bacterium]